MKEENQMTCHIGQNYHNIPLGRFPILYRVLDGIIIHKHLIIILWSYLMTFYETVKIQNF